MAATVALIADSLSAFAPVRVWECLQCRKRWAVDVATGCPYCLGEQERNSVETVKKGDEEIGC
jgi:hypothetical protein